MIDSLHDPPNDSSPHLKRIALLSVLAIALLVPACATVDGEGSPAAPAGAASGESAEPADRVDRTAVDGDGDRADTGTGTGTAPASETQTAKGPATLPPAPPAADPAPDPDPDGGAVEEEKEEEEEDRKKRRIVLDTVYDDARVGAEETPAIEAELGVLDDEALNAYVRRVALRLLQYAPPLPFDYEFKIVDQTVPNAFALPGGKIYVSRGLLALVTSEDELAGVLGHEITHAAERHASARLEYSKRLNPFSIGILRAARIAAYGRDQERDADRGGQILAAKAGYDPTAIADFLRKLDASERYEIGWSRIPSFFATHPTSPERAALAIERAQGLDWEPLAPVAGIGPEAYYEKIDGLVLGPDPAGGIFDEENEFVHPELRFSLRFPRGWETMNSAQAVRAISPRYDAQAELTLAGSGDQPIEELVDEFLEGEFDGLSVRVRERRPLKVGGLDAIRIRGRASSQGGPSLHADMTFIAYDDLVYRLTVLSLDPGRYQGRTHAFVQSFRPLDDEGVRSLRVTRLRIARAREDETLQALSARTRNELEVVFTGVLNGIYAQTPLARRTPIKIGIAEPYLPKPQEEEDEEGPEQEVER